jgi:hypothetical protein
MRVTIDTAATRTSTLVLVLALSSSCTPQQAKEEAIGSARAQQPAATVQRAAIVGPTRTERDLLGDKQIPVDAYYGVQTARAIENFRISGVAINHYPGFVEAWAIVKLAAARANTDVGAMKPETLAAIEKAAAAVMNGKYHDPGGRRNARRSTTRRFRSWLTASSGSATHRRFICSGTSVRTATGFRKDKASRRTTTSSWAVSHGCRSFRPTADGCFTSEPTCDTATPTKAR